MKLVLLAVLELSALIHFHGSEAKVVRRYTPHFENGVKMSTVHSSSVDEASGLCASRLHPDVLYTHNDSGGGSRIYAINATTGSKISTITVDGSGSHDWEDIACGPCPAYNGKMCVFIADTGGNVHYAANVIYRIVEPERFHSSMTVHLDSKLQFRWDEENCETLMVDPHGEVYVVSKVHGGHGKMVHLPASAWGSSHRVSANHGIRLQLDSTRNDPVGGDISPTGYEVLVKTLGAVNHYYVPDGDYLRHMAGKPRQLPYHHERQGESVAWAANAGGYFTLGEGKDPPLYFYKRQAHSAVVG